VIVDLFWRHIIFFVANLLCDLSNQLEIFVVKCGICDLKKLVDNLIVNVQTFYNVYLELIHN
jgi:hypothetical protein